jgi:hypothetical protein
MSMKKLQCLLIMLLFSVIILSSCVRSGRPKNVETSVVADKMDKKAVSIAAKNNIVESKEDHDTDSIIKGVFDIPEVNVSKSPSKPSSISFPGDEKVIDFDISPSGPFAAVLVENVNKTASIKFWNIGDKDFFDEFIISVGFRVKSIAWHPLANSLFIVAVKDNKNHILRVEKAGKSWTCKTIYSSPKQLRRLVIAPRPFITGNKDYYSYRLFFGMQTAENSYRIVSVTETGKKFYQVIGPDSTFTHFANPYSKSSEVDPRLDPSHMVADFALPVSFHPSGKELIWNNADGNYFVASYEYMAWDKSKPSAFGSLKGGTITPTPNGLGFIHWQNDKPGIGIYMLATKKEERQAVEYKFISTPSSVPDGRGIVGLTKEDTYILKYVPIKVPLADVLNAWMFSESPEEINRFEDSRGLFRDVDHDQLYQLYETENYYCDNYSRTTPTRPYLVTTDIMWELFGSALQGIFIVKERDVAIPAFWEFIIKGNQFYQNSTDPSPWKDVFKSLTDLHENKQDNSEANNIRNAQSMIYSEVLKDKFDFSELKPRGHYTSLAQMQDYFKAFKYFTLIFENKNSIIRKLEKLPVEIRDLANSWIKSYDGFISPSRGRLVFNNEKANRPKYVQYPDTNLTIFPLSWGFDNEVLYSTVYHQNFPADKQIVSKNGARRITPSGLDLAAALESSIADSLLLNEFNEYPNLRKTIESLRENFRKNGKAKNDNINLYDKWITALAVQWADSVTSANENKDKKLWQTKRLQTGLSSWATLRHTTILVNVRGAAECGESGFEEIVMRAPRGYVEPDPYTFAIIADLFENAMKYLPKSMSDRKNFKDEGGVVVGSLYDGINFRLKESADKARKFQLIAEKERRGEPLTNEEYEQILYVARTAEHYFLIFKSLANEDYALSFPDPMAKIADVAGGGPFKVPYLMAAVGNPLEWDYIVPFFGRRQIVKGSVYSYYEFISDRLLNDKEWQQKVKSQSHPQWINSYIAGQKLSYPPESGY